VFKPTKYIWGYYLDTITTTNDVSTTSLGSFTSDINTSLIA